jgi:hypothetical protein
VTAHDFTGHYLFDYACEGLVDAVKKAAALAKYPLGHAWHDYEPYYGTLVGTAVWQARYVMREAQRLGLYPQTQQLARSAA